MAVQQFESKKSFDSNYASFEGSFELPPKLTEELALHYPHEPFQLHLREYLHQGELSYEAHLAHTDSTDPEALALTIPISQELFTYYRWRDIPADEPQLSAAEIVTNIHRALQDNKPATVHIGGRSGSGKSTIVREVRTALDALGLTSAVLSTDDYHRGNSWLVAHNNGQDWEHWDAPIVYDTETMAQDLKTLQSGQAIRAREIDWTTVEPHYPGLISPSDVIVIEGIYARSPDITSEGDLSYEMTTPLATCIGRRLLRDLKERPQFADPVKSLSYMLSEAEPAYLRQQHA